MKAFFISYSSFMLQAHQRNINRTNQVKILIKLKFHDFPQTISGRVIELQKNDEVCSG